VNMADSNGIASPASWKYIASRFRAAIGPDKGLMTHNHNDYGQALANTLAAVEGGANWLGASLVESTLWLLGIAIRPLYPRSLSSNHALMAPAAHSTVTISGWRGGYCPGRRSFPPGAGPSGGSSGLLEGPRPFPSGWEVPGSRSEQLE
jgi:hypothetical protein